MFASAVKAFQDERIDRRFGYAEPAARVRPWVVAVFRRAGVNAGRKPIGAESLPTIPSRSPALSVGPAYDSSLTIVGT